MGELNNWKGELNKVEMEIKNMALHWDLPRMIFLLFLEIYCEM